MFMLSLFSTHYRTYLLTALFVCVFFLGSFDITFAFIDVLENFIKSTIYNVIVAVGVLVMTVGAFMLDASVSQLVVQMGEKLGGAQGLGGSIKSLWLIIRDLFNIFFIFSLIYIGIRTILKSEDSGTRRMLGHLIIAALFINFSLYITQAITDFSNVASVQIYNQISTVGETDIGVGTLGGIPGAFLQSVRFTSLLGAKNPTDTMSMGDAFVYAIFMLVFLLVSGMVFAWAGILIVTRFVALIFYMILSPMMFLGLVLPNFKKYGDKWWGGFLNQCFFAPTLLFGLYMSLIGIQGLQGAFFGVGEFTTILEPGPVNPGMFGMVLYFIIMIGFLIGSIKLAQSMAEVGAKTALKYVASATKNVGGYAASQAVGWSSDKVSKAYDKFEEKKGRVPFLSQNIRTTLDKGKAAKFGGSSSYKDRSDYAEKRDTEISRARSTTAIGDAIAAGTRTNATGRDKIEMERLVAKASNPQILEMAKSEKGREALLAAAGDLNQEQIKALNGADTLSDEFKSSLGSAVQNATVNRLGLIAQPQDINKASKDQLKSIGYEQLFANAEFLQDGQLDDMKGFTSDGTITQTELTQIKDERKRKITRAANSPQTALTIINSRKSEKEVAKLPKEFLESRNFIDAARLPNAEHKITASLLTKIAQESDGVSKPTIGNNIRASYGNNNLPADVRNFFQSAMGGMFT